MLGCNPSTLLKEIMGMLTFITKPVITDEDIERLVSIFGEA
jgi:hypothetical protein